MTDVWLILGIFLFVANVAAMLVSSTDDNTSGVMFSGIGMCGAVVLIVINVPGVTA